jgi:hypothetical protein
MTKELLAKIENGDGLTDEELETALGFYTDLEGKLRLLGPKFHLAWVEVLRTQQALASFKFHRGFDNRWLTAVGS